MTQLLVVLAVILGTYLVRISLFVGPQRRGLPQWLSRRIGLVAPAAIGALVGGAAVHDSAGPSAILLAGIAAFLASRHTKSPYAALAVGFPVLWCLRLAGLS